MSNKIGRPLKFKTVEELTNKIDEYFNSIPQVEWTITGLAIALDTYRDVLIDYQNGMHDKIKGENGEIEDKDYSNAVKKAKLLVENSYEIDLKKTGRSGTIFALKNFNWKDTQESIVKIEAPKPLLNSILDTKGEYKETKSDV